MAELTDPLDTVRSRLPDVEGLRPLSGGASSLTYVGQTADRPVVVKVAPAGLAPTRHRDVLRQARVIKALHSTPLPVPDVLFEDPGDPPLVPPLFVMSWVDGSSVEPLYDVGAAVDSAVPQRYRSAAEMLAQLHRVDHSAVGLGDEPVSSAGAEVERWCRALQTVEPALAPGWRDVADALAESVPAPLGPALVHGDFRLGNLLAVGADITAVIDWEIWSVGDPRVDVGWFLINSDPRTYRRATRYLGMTPNPTELASTYRTALGVPVPDLDWFQALACFKSVATWSLIVKHNRRRSVPAADVAAMATVLPHLLIRAGELLG